MKRLIATISLAVLGFQSVMAAEQVTAEVLFARKVLPLFKERCIVCHGEDPKKKLKIGRASCRERV